MIELRAKVELMILEAQRLCEERDPEQLQINIPTSHSVVLPPFPKAVRKIWLSGFQTSTLPPLPEGLQSLVCTNCGLESLPSLPEGLKVLLVENNFLKVLPPLPSTLESLIVTKNFIKELPPLPNSLKRLDCEENGILKYPPLPPNLNSFVAGCLDPDLLLPSRLEILTFTLAGDVSRIPELPETIWILSTYDFQNPMARRFLHDPKEILRSQAFRRMKRVQKRCAAIKEELIAAVWHPRRMAFWSQQE